MSCIRNLVWNLSIIYWMIWIRHIMISINNLSIHQLLKSMMKYISCLINFRNNQHIIIIAVVMQNYGIMLINYTKKVLPLNHYFFILKINKKNSQYIVNWSKFMTNFYKKFIIKLHQHCSKMWIFNLLSMMHIFVVLMTNKIFHY